MSQLSVTRLEVHDVFRASSMVTDRLVHLVPDELAAKVPDHCLFAYPRDENSQHGFVEVSARQFANAVNRTSWYLEALVGAPRDFDTICYIGANDLRYILLMFAAIKVGYKMLFLSPRNSLEGHLHVICSVKCHVLLHSRKAKVNHILDSRALLSCVVPELGNLLQDDAVPIYPYTKTFAEACNDPALVLHTTGTTGLPKPITWRVGALSTYEAWRTIPHVNGFAPTTEVYQEARRVYASMPLFHTSGLNAAITWPLLLGVTLVYGAPHVIPNAVYTDEMHRYAGVDGSIGAPSLYEELAREPESLERMGNLKFVVASGAPISDAAGEAISKYTRVIPNLGSTETACLQRLAPAIEDWAYFYWHPTHSGIEMRPWMDGLYELFLIRDPKLVRYQGIFSTFPHIQEWSMGDLYSQHPDPSKPFLYRYRGRKDDVIVLSNGEKVSPALMEAALQSSPLVRGAMILGKGRFQPAALIDLGIEPPADDMGRQRVLAELEPFITQANIHAPAHGQLDKYHLLFTDPQRPVHYLGQGKIQRYRTTALYEKDIEVLYETIEEDAEAILAVSGLSELPLFDFSREHSLETSLRELLTHTSRLAGPALGSEQNIFEFGVDSLQVLRMARELNIQLRSAGIQPLGGSRMIAAQIYSNPTLSKLSVSLLNMTATTKQADHYRVAKMQSLLDKYVALLPKTTKATYPTLREDSNNWTVLLTGSTGSLGSYILHELQNDRRIKRIVCLDRSSDAAKRHVITGRERGLSGIDSARVTFLQADLARPFLGLASETYESLRASVTHIIHNQWPVNFHWPLALFEPSIEGVGNLANLAAISQRGAFILFVSSVSSVGGGGSNKKRSGTSLPFPETLVTDFSMAAHMGYGESKLVSERLLAEAATICGVRSAICRVGIVSGPVERRQGLWNKHEYIPSIMVSSQALGVFPSSFPGRDRIDWLPVDKVSKVLVEILRSASTTTTSVPALSPNNGDHHNDISAVQTFHVVNPQAGSWDTDIAAVAIPMYPKTATTITKMHAVSMADWVARLRASAEEAERTGDFDLEKNPAIRLLDFFAATTASGAGAGSAGVIGGQQHEEGPRWLSSTRAESSSATLRELGPPRKEWLENWMAQWGITSTQ